jgi:hypothetical protein
VALSYSLNPSPIPLPSAALSILVTGAAGMIGRRFCEHARGKYTLRLMVRAGEDAARIDAIRSFGEIVEAELSDLPRLKELCRGVDTVLHLAADPDANATWESLLPNNIIGTYNIMAAAKAAGCRRLIYASSIHAVGGYGKAVQVKTSEPPNPGDLYGVSKCFGEALGRYMAEQEGLSVIAIRIGAYQPPEKMQRAEGMSLVDCWVSPRDLNQLIDRCITATHIRFAIVNGLSNNTFNHLDLSDARELLGYEPQDDAMKLLPQLAETEIRERLMGHNMSDAWAKSGLRNST